ncbi:SH3 domain-containing protein [Alteribacter keqinensis]|uniref:Ligand-binding protein SH3 n=1 Tax=Alteribacter keqinensis TaxID=2483800 RepID=A0A3M7TLW9_9BACI|nr:SH3 domain-containing protein [Alteribacter keqinensis]RNA66601.1 ligand-binding protein SH3 [Alteribacter keqinensis]
MKYIIMKPHKSNYPDPITLSKGEKVRTGRIYEGPEGWENWIYCTTVNGESEGWVPAQIINDHVITEDYCAKELNIDAGEQVEVVKELNGWLWVKNVRTGEEGWIPREAAKLIQGDET